jgi:opacity protein-like surface antigen
MSLKLRIALLAASVLPLGHALAADLDPPIYADQPAEYVPVEVGTGWYLRGDLGYQINDDAFSRDRDLSGDYRIGGFDVDDSENRFTGSVGIGYHFTDYLRTDLNAGYIDGNELSVGYDDGGNVVDAKVENEAWYGMANVYVDLGTVAGFTPYVGAGAGVLSNKSSWNASFNLDGEDAYGDDDEHRDYAFAYTLNAGFAYRFTDNLSMDVGYQYLASPDAEYRDVTDPEDYPTHDGLEFHQVRAGLRYDLW